MKTTEAIHFFGGLKKLSDALGVWPQYIYTWKEYPPMGRQYQIEVVSKGALKADFVTSDLTSTNKKVVSQNAKNND